MVGRLDAGVRHVHIAVLEDDGALRIEEVLDADASLRCELEPSAQLRCSCMERGIKDARAHVEKRHEAAGGFAVEAKQERLPGDAPAGVDGIAQKPFAQDFEPARRQARAWRVPGDKAELGLRDEQIDVRNVPRNRVFERAASALNPNPEARYSKNSVRVSVGFDRCTTECCWRAHS